MATSVPYTTLAQAATKTDELIKLASGTDLVANKRIVVVTPGSMPESLGIREVVSTVYARVKRGLDGTRALDHNSGDRAYVAPPIYFGQNDPAGLAGANAMPYLPHIVLPTGKIFVPFNTEWLEVPPARRVNTLRTRVAIADIIAGLTLLPALPAFAYRLVSAHAIAIGGAAGAVTTVDILGTQGAASAKLVAFAQANLTQSTRLTAGGTGATILANGASFAACDVNTAITIGQTGANITTATHVDVEVMYSIEAP